MTRPNESKAHVCTPLHKLPDHGQKHTKKQKWCPYCGEWRRFKAKKVVHMDGSKTIGYKRCTGCGISAEDYWIKHSNNLWEISLKPTGKGKGRR
jgi:Pyruvate/2-oxoacid:ferredoxin oxidoreductase delta subunit